MSNLRATLHSIWCIVTGRCSIVDRDLIARDDPVIQRWKKREQVSNLRTERRRRASRDLLDGLYTGNE